MNNNNQNKSEGVTISKRTLIIIIVSIVVILLLIVASFVFALNWNNWFGEGEPTDTTATEDSSESGWKPEIDDDAGDYKPSQPIPDAGGTATGIKIPGYPRIPVKSGSTTAPVALLNPEGNPCYFCFEIVIEETGESLYKSKMVPPGQAISGITLSRVLEKGKYPALIKITTFSLEDGSTMNGANVETAIDVQ